MYLDPGFGSMLVQVLIASFAAVAVGVGVFRQRIKAFFIKNKSENLTDDTTVDEVDENLTSNLDRAVPDNKDSIEAGEDSYDE